MINIDKIDKILFPFLYKDNFKKALCFIAPSTFLQPELNEFNSHIADFNKVNEELRKIINHNNAIFNNSTPKIDTVIDKSNEIINIGSGGTWDIAKSTKGDEIANWVFDIIGKVFLLVWNNVFPVVKWMCIIAALVGILMSVCGHTKGKNITISSVVIYIVMKLLDILIN